MTVTADREPLSILTPTLHFHPVWSMGTRQKACSTSVAELRSTGTSSRSKGASGLLHWIYVVVASR